jgi:phage terminase large subunit
MINEERFEFNECYEPVFTTKARYIDIFGGRAAGRSHFGTDYFLYLITGPDYFRGCFLRNVFSDIRDSLFQDFKDRIENSCFDERDFEINESKMSVTYKPTGNTIISKGFKKSAGNRSAKLKSLAGLTHVMIEEADENEEKDVNKLDDSIRTNKVENIQIIFLHNPPKKNHWLIKRFYNLVDCGLLLPNGKPAPYYKAIPKSRPDFLSIFTTYKDNVVNLNSKTISKYEAYGDPESPDYDEEMYYVDVLGLVPEGARGRIYRNWKPCTTEFFNSLPYPEYYGLDFGYSTDPVALVKIKTHNNRNFFKEVIYETDLTNPKLAELMILRGVPKTARIYADSAEPKSIQELKDLGFRNIIPAIKGPDSLLFGIKQLRSMENYITEDSKKMWEENEDYKWKLDNDGNPTDEPEDKNNHLKDAARYGVTTDRDIKRKSNIKVANTSTQTFNDGGNSSEPTNPLDWV